MKNYTMKHLFKDKTAKIKELLKKAPFILAMDKSKDLQVLHHLEKKKGKCSKLPQKSKNKFVVALDMTQQEINGWLKENKQKAFKPLKKKRFMKELDLKKTIVEQPNNQTSKFPVLDFFFPQTLIMERSPYEVKLVEQKFLILQMWWREKIQKIFKKWKLCWKKIEELANLKEIFLNFDDNVAPN
jgi:hypothetical protein